MGRLALLPLGAAALFAIIAWTTHEWTEARRMDAVVQAVIASGHPGPVQVEAIRGDECWRAREGFRWEAADATGWACAGPGREVRIKSTIPRSAPQGSL